MIIAKIYKKILLLCLLSSFILHAEAQLIEPGYGVVEEIDATLVPVKRGNLYGFVDRQNQTKIPADFEKVSFFNERGYAHINKYGLFGVIDKSGKEIIPPLSSGKVQLEVSKNKNFKLKKGTDYVDEETSIGFISNYKSKKFCFYKESGGNFKIFEGKLNKSTFDSQISYFSKLDDGGRFYQHYARIVNDDGKVNFIDTLLNVVFNEYIFDGFQLDKDLFAEYNEKGLVRVIDKDRVGLTSFDFKKITPCGDNNLYIVEVKGPSYGNIFGLMNGQGKLQIDTIYSSITYLGNNYFLFDENGKKGVMDQNANRLIHPKYYDIKYFTEDKFICKSDDGLYIVNSEEKSLLGPYESITKQGLSNCLVIKDTVQYSYVDQSLKKQFSKEKEFRVSQVLGEHIVIYQGGLNHLMDLKGNDVIGKPLKSIKSTYLDKIIITQSDLGSGLYDLSEDKWIYPEGDYHISLKSLAYHGEESIVLNGQQKKITIKKSLKDKTIEENKSSYSASYRKSKDGRQTIVNFLGETYTFPTEDNYRVETMDDKLYYQKKEGRHKLLYNTDLKKILPKGFYLNRTHKFGDKQYFSVYNDKEERGVCDFNGNWMIKPLACRKINFYQDYFIGIPLPDGDRIYDDKFKQITEKKYNKISAKGELILMTYGDDNLLDIYSKGKLISSGEFVDVVSTRSNDFTAQLNPMDTLRTALVRNNGEWLIDLPFYDIIPVDSTYGRFIVKDSHDYGILKKDKTLVKEVKFKEIRFFPEGNVFVCRKQDYYNDLLTLDNELIVKDFEGYVQFKHHKEVGYSIQGEKETLLFDLNGELINSFPKEYGYLSPSKNLFDQGIIQFSANGRAKLFVDMKSGIKYE